jgi:hypothetical protein
MECIETHTETWSTAAITNGQLKAVRKVSPARLMSISFAMYSYHSFNKGTPAKSPITIWPEFMGLNLTGPNSLTTESPNIELEKVDVSPHSSAQTSVWSDIGLNARNINFGPSSQI